jgi:hypothetical protein
LITAVERIPLMIKGRCVVAALCTLTSGICVAQPLTFYESQIVSPNDFYERDAGFGFDGHTLLVGAELHGNNYSYGQQKRVRVFQGDDQYYYTEQPQIISGPPDPQSFSGSLAVSGDFMLMGAPGYSTYLINSEGSATVFQRTGQSWSPIGGFHGSATYDFLGQSVDLNGQRMIVGAPGQKAFGTAYIATTDTDWNGNWTISQVAGSGSLFSYTSFGAAVAIEGDTAIVGAPGSGDPGPSAYIFHRNASGQWSQIDRLFGDDTHGTFGASVDIHDGLILFGDPYESGVGAAYVYKQTGRTSWTREAKLLRPGANSQERFGTSVSIGDNGDLLVGVPQYSDIVPWGGTAILFTPDGTGGWQQSAMLLPSISDEGSNFGQQVALHNGIAVVSAKTEFGYLGPVGAEFIYTNIPEPTGVHLAAVLAFAAIGSSHWRRRDSK